MLTPPTVEQRREVEELVCDLPGARPGEMAFEHPWEIRAFALAVSAHKAGRIQWPDFQAALATSIKQWEDSVDDLHDSSWSYYHHWVNALQKVLEDKLATTDLDGKTREVLATPANRNHHKAVLEPIAIDPGRI
ncbi:nitrile hydratase accessory protein (plasmid) [Rhodococcus pyridinivorans]|uniref:nitrile hydratase accessory protein n=1 Tax=Rhodococcus TaxID=1827 RepID=UPI00200A3F16|nr:MULTISPECIES: nitrile hydratase accessory protein [Rhodococcus]MDV6296691.1 nitrile hydratase accessory protein [Rhodococcus aetherivorans]UPW06932.1 nitrile hydratase accessory protein [Rhodococcus pyridinivorans]